MNSETIDAKVFLGRVFVQTHINLQLRGVDCHAIVDGIKCTYGGETIVVADLGSLTEGFFELGADHSDVGDALAAGVLDRFGVEHRLQNHGLTMAICGVKVDG